MEARLRTTDNPGPEASTEASRETRGDEDDPGVAAAASLARRPTIFDVARVAGVSYSTVSRVVNGHANIRADTRARVQAAMADLGYVAHVTARALASGRTQTIGLLARGIDNPFFSAVIKGVDQEVSEADYDLLLCTTHSRSEQEGRYVARLSHGMVDGLLIVVPTALPEYVSQLRAQRYPFVLIDHDSDAPGCTVVNAANRSGTREGIAYLIELGHRRIGFITGRPDVGAATERLEGYREALRDADQAFDEELVVTGDFMEERGYAAAQELLGLPDPPTAIFASSDVAAFGVLSAARDAGLRVPDDLSVLGFDDIVEAAWLGPGLSTVRQPLREMGRVAVQRLISLLADPSRPAVRVVMDTELVVRNTTAPPRRTRAAGSPGLSRVADRSRATAGTPLARGSHEGSPGR
jgi:LacI family transcriptional regulator